MAPEEFAQFLCAQKHKGQKCYNTVLLTVISPLFYLSTALALVTRSNASCFLSPYLIIDDKIIPSAEEDAYPKGACGVRLAPDRSATW